MTDGVFARSLVLASAGSGKTYQLSSRLVALMAAGAPPESILASTFTRKAAGEILERVLHRLAQAALDGHHPDCDGKAEELAASLPMGVPPERMTREAFQDLLVETVGTLHRIQVQTLDAFVHRAVRSFALELGLPTGWTVGEDPLGERLRSRAVEEVLRDGSSGSVAEMLRILKLGGADRAVHRDLLEFMEQTHRLFRERDTGVDSIWGFQEPFHPALADSRWEELADRVARVGERWVEEEALGGRWQEALARVEEALRARDGAALVRQTLWKNAWKEEGTGEVPRYNRKPIHPELLDLFKTVAVELPALVGPTYQRQVETLGLLLPAYHERLQALRREQGVYSFDDLVHALAEGGIMGEPEEFYYRLDGRIRHLLLDEFQDTSATQWSALAPLADELLSGHEGERAFFVVADPKQSIYGWRGGEPRLLDRLRDRYQLEKGTLNRSWRSSPVVLRFVNRVFQDFSLNPVFREPEDARVAAVWMEAFTPHRAAFPERPGYVEVRVGPEEAPGIRGNLRPDLLKAVAEQLRALHLQHPGISIGVLTRTNAVATRIMAELKGLGVEASEEGGVPVNDSPAVLAVLSLLRLADHPGDRISAYLAAHSPLEAGEGLTDFRNPAAVERVGVRVRRRLLTQGYGVVVSGWAEELRRSGSERDDRRLDQLVEMAFEWEERATLRPADFVRWVESARREDAGAAPVRIMTIHRSKGLEFDAVVLPELDASLRSGGRGRRVVPYRAVPGGPVTRIFPSLPLDLAPWFPEMAPALEQVREAELRDGLSALYVALTRARHALYLTLRPDGASPSRALSSARLVREAPGLRGEGFQSSALDGKGRLLPEEILFRSGDEGWFRRLEGRPIPASADARLPVAEARIVLARSPRRRLLPRRTPSDMEGGDRVPLATLLAAPPRGALERGTLVHAWLEEMEWMEAPPEPSSLRETAVQVAPRLEGREALIAAFLSWLEEPAVRRYLLRSEWPEGTQVLREGPFLARREGVILQGVADRVLTVPERGLVVVDWKTDRVEGEEGLAERVRHYRPQMEAYLSALTGLQGRPAEGRLVFLSVGRVVEVPAPGE